MHGNYSNRIIDLYGVIMLKLLINYKCLSTENKGRVRITVDKWENKCVADLKLLVEETLCAPCCDQVLSYQGRTLKDGSRLLKEFYLREGDEIEVRFPSEADTKEVRELVNVLNQFVEKMCSKQDDILWPRTGLDIDAFQNHYNMVINSLEALSVNSFQPWKRPKTCANRHYFVQVNGFNSFMEILKFALQEYQAQDKQRSHLNAVCQLNILQCKLLVWCFFFLWNFCETPDELKLMIKSGVLPLATKAFLLDPNTLQSKSCPLNDELKSLLIEINFHSLGSLTGCTEINQAARLTVASNTNVINKMVAMMDRSLPHTREMYTLFCSQCAGNGLFFCTWSRQTHIVFLQNGFHFKIIDITTKCIGDSSGDVVIRYTGCLILAVLSTSCSAELDPNTMKTINQLIEDFLQCNKPNEMLAWEEEHGYVWVTLLPLIQLMFSGGPPVKKGYPPVIQGKASGNSEGSSFQTVFTDPVLSDMDQMLALCHIDSVVTAQTEVKVRKKERSFSDELNKRQTQNPGPLVDGVSLSFDTNEKAKCPRDFPELPRWPGSLSIQKLGLFALTYLLCVEENRRLLKSERLLEYLICLSWSLRLEEHTVLMEHLKKFNHIETPSLKTICKSVLARMYGLQTVLEL